MQAMGRAQQQGSGAARTFPPTRLEWRATQEKASMALDVGCFNGELSSPHWSQQAPVCPRDQEKLAGGGLSGCGSGGKRSACGRGGWTWNGGRQLGQGGCRSRVQSKSGEAGGEVAELGH